MALTAHVTARFGAASPFLVGLTNHDDEDRSTVNDTRLAEAATAAEGDFPVEAQVNYDDTNAAHVNAGVLGVIAYLRMWSSAQGKAEGEMAKFKEALAKIAKVSSRKRITPIQAVRAQQEGDEDNWYGLSPEFETHSEDA